MTELIHSHQDSNPTVYSGNVSLTQAGSTYCCIAALSMLGGPDESDDTIRWLVHRQGNTKDEEIGGFSGRVNKPADTCYSFWVGGALDVCLPTSRN